MYSSCRVGATVRVEEEPKASLIPRYCRERAAAVWLAGPFSMGREQLMKEDLSSTVSRCEGQ